MNSRFFPTFALIVTVFCLSGCAIFEQGISTIPIGFGLFRSPVTYKTSLWANGPLTNYEKCRLEAMSDSVRLVGQKLTIRDSVFRSEDSAFCRGLQDELLDYGQFGKQVEFDDLSDLYDPKKNDTLVFVALSGGGARATVLAHAVFVLLERKFNVFKTVHKNKRTPSLLNNLDIISSVSGGSLYAYKVARYKTSLENDKLILEDLVNKLKDNDNARKTYELLGEIYYYNRFENFQCSSDEFSMSAVSICASKINNLLKDEIPKWEDNAFEYIAKYRTISLQKPGLLATGAYLWPTATFVGPLTTFLTNETYLSTLASMLNLYGPPGEIPKRALGTFELARQIYDPSVYKLSYIVNTPRFFFNATALETGLPFVFTQRLIHLPTKNPLLNKTVRLDLSLKPKYGYSPEEERLARIRRPLNSIITLEDLNSSPSEMSLSFAAMASAAFPIGFEPLTLTKYGYDPVGQQVYESTEKLHVSDGGLYGNL